MSIIHHCWEPHGRTLRDDSVLDCYVYKTTVGQYNVDRGDGSFAPFVYDPTNKVVRFADCELRFVVGGLQFWRDKQQIGALAFYPETLRGSTWRRDTATIGPLQITEQDTGDARATITFAYRVSTTDYRADVSITLGGSHLVRFRFDVQALKAGEHALVVEWGDAIEPIQEYGRNRDTGAIELLTPTAVRTNGMWQRWFVQEQALHAIEAPDKRVRLGHKIYQADEQLTISPDVMGPLYITANEDDIGISGDAELYLFVSGEGGGVAWMGDYPSGYNYTGAFRFALSGALSSSAEVSDATLKVYGKDAWNWNGSSDALVVYGEQSSNAAQVSTEANHPWDGSSPRTLATNSVRWPTSGGLSWNTSGWNTTPSLASIINELIDDYSGLASGAHIQLWTGMASGSGHQREVGYEDYSHTDTHHSELSITYSTGGTVSHVGLLLLGAGL